MEFKALEKALNDKVIELGYELVSVTHRVEKGEQILSIVVDRVEPIDMNAIVEISRSLNAFIDELNPIDNPYTLDISSLGAEKPLKIERLGEYVGQFIHVHIVNPIEGLNIYEGTLEAVKEETIKVSYKVKTRTKYVDIQKGNISKIRLAIKF